MPVWHIALFRIKPNVSPASINLFKTSCKAMVGQIPGLTKLEVGPPLESTAHRAKGFNISVMAVMEKPEDVKVYAEHPVHKPILDLRWKIFEEDMVAYDLVYEDK